MRHYGHYWDSLRALLGQDDIALEVGSGEAGKAPEVVDKTRADGTKALT